MSEKKEKESEELKQTEGVERGKEQKTMQDWEYSWQSSLKRCKLPQD